VPVTDRHTAASAHKKAPPVTTGGAFSVVGQLVQVCVPAGTAIAEKAFWTATHWADPVP
jgi:hypothetical protein